MKNWLKTALIITIMLTPLAYALPASAVITINSIQITDLKNNRATLNWRTNESTKSIIYYGPAADQLTYRLEFNVYTTQHQAVLNNLDEDETYYYKIKALGFGGELTESFIQNFSTDGMIDDRAPDIEEAEVLHNTGDAVALSWTTDEKTRAEIYYGLDDSDLDKKKTVGKYTIEHELFIYKLQPNTKYYLKIVAKDKAGNSDTTTLRFYTSYSSQKKPAMSIYSVRPIAPDDELISYNEATIKFKTTLPARAYIRYGTDPKKYKYKTEYKEQELNTQHSIDLNNLQANTTYYFEIKTANGMYNKNITSAEYSFRTKAEQVLGTKISAGPIDSDHDELTDSYELSIGTDPYNADTDGDGYRDGVEVANGYNPKGPGKLVKLIYGRPRLSGDIEMAKSIELKQALEQRIGNLTLGREGWFTVVNAYIYGDYPVEAIAQAIKWSGKTVHPTIGWSAWKNSSDYQTYINK